MAVLLLRLHVISEETSKRLDKVPAKVRVIVTRRPKYAWTPALLGGQRTLRAATAAMPIDFHGNLRSTTSDTSIPKVLWPSGPHVRYPVEVAERTLLFSALLRGMNRRSRAESDGNRRLTQRNANTDHHAIAKASNIRFSA